MSTARTSMRDNDGRPVTRAAIRRLASLHVALLIDGALGEGWPQADNLGPTWTQDMRSALAEEIENMAERLHERAAQPWMSSR